MPCPPIIELDRPTWRERLIAEIDPCEPGDVLVLDPERLLRDEVLLADLAEPYRLTDPERAVPADQPKPAPGRMLTLIHDQDHKAWKGKPESIRVVDLSNYRVMWNPDWESLDDMWQHSQEDASAPVPLADFLRELELAKRGVGTPTQVGATPPRVSPPGHAMPRRPTLRSSATRWLAYALAGLEAPSDRAPGHGVFADPQVQTLFEAWWTRHAPWLAWASSTRRPLLLEDAVRSEYQDAKRYGHAPAVILLIEGFGITEGLRLRNTLRMPESAVSVSTSGVFASSLRRTERMLQGEPGIPDLRILPAGPEGLRRLRAASRSNAEHLSLVRLLPDVSPAAADKPWSEASLAAIAMTVEVLVHQGKTVVLIGAAEPAQSGNSAPLLAWLRVHSAREDDDWMELEMTCIRRVP